MSFTVTPLLNQRVLVEGTDTRGTTGSVILDGAQWLALNARMDHEQAHDKYDAAVEKFFAPLTDAAEAVHAPKEDPASRLDMIVFSEEVKAVKAKPAEILTLHAHTTILRLIHTGDTGLLVWVSGELVVIDPAADFKLAEPRSKGPSAEDLQEFMDGLNDIFGEGNVQVVDLSETVFGEDDETTQAEPETRVASDDEVAIDTEEKDDSTE